MFENDVIWYGTQTNQKHYTEEEAFENDVIWYGTQTYISDTKPDPCLRMM